MATCFVAADALKAQIVLISTHCYFDANDLVMAYSFKNN